VGCRGLEELTGNGELKDWETACYKAFRDIAKIPRLFWALMLGRFPDRNAFL